MQLSWIDFHDALWIFCNPALTVGFQRGLEGFLPLDLTKYLMSGEREHISDRPFPKLTRVGAFQQHWMRPSFRFALT